MENKNLKIAKLVDIAKERIKLSKEDLDTIALLLELAYQHGRTDGVDIANKEINRVISLFKSK